MSDDGYPTGERPPPNPLVRRLVAPALIVAVLVVTGRLTAHGPAAAHYTEPPVAAGQTLTRDELHWCVREEIALDAQATIAKSVAQQRGYEADTDAFHQRCDGAVYRGDRDAATAEVERDRAAIEQNARATYFVAPVPQPGSGIDPLPVLPASRPPAAPGGPTIATGPLVIPAATGSAR